MGYTCCQKPLFEVACRKNGKQKSFFATSFSPALNLSVMSRVILQNQSANIPKQIKHPLLQGFPKWPGWDNFEFCLADVQRVTDGL